MEELKVGMYAYSKESRERGIGKIISIDETRPHLEVTIQTKNGKLKTRKEFVIANSNIIDLIEAGDYVNRYLVMAVYLTGTNKYLKLSNFYSKENNYSGVRTYSEDIKSILTKEQFEREAYKL